MHTVNTSIKTKFQIILFLIINLSFYNSLFAESVRLTSGQILEGKILEDSEKVIVIQTNKGTFTVRKVDILEMERPGSKDTIVKPPEEKKIGKLGLAFMSFIPGYSPIYQSKEHPEFGVPLAMLSLNYFYHLLQFQFNSSRPGFLNSIEMKNPMALYYNVFVAPTIVGEQMGIISKNPTNNPINDFYTYSQALTTYINVRSILYQNNNDRIVEGKLMTEEVYLNERKKNLASFVAVSVLNGAISYYLLSSEGNLGALYKTETKGIKTVFYAFPAPDGGIFGVASRF